MRVICLNAIKPWKNNLFASVHETMTSCPKKRLWYATCMRLTQTSWCLYHLSQSARYLLHIRIGIAGVYAFKGGCICHTLHSWASEKRWKSQPAIDEETLQVRTHILVPCFSFAFLRLLGWWRHGYTCRFGRECRIRTMSLMLWYCFLHMQKWTRQARVRSTVSCISHKFVQRGVEKDIL
jgi:hypothetical protein